MIVARQLILSGRVQRVGFRWFAAEAAEREGVGGWVANTRDGRVEIYVEGDAEAVERFERSVRRGPIAARVDEVETTVHPPTGRTTGFQVRR
ncbi:MAG TPA: acylphosphatase [Vicinamibacterales bacterium]|nr:acylphosphatase [Vicinamibacterales bacterium]